MKNAGPEIENTLRFVTLLLKPEMLKPLKEIYGMWMETNKCHNQFFIPLDSSILLESGGTMSVLVGFGAINLSDLIAPPDSWVSKLSREMVFILPRLFLVPMRLTTKFATCSRCSRIHDTH